MALFDDREQAFEKKYANDQQTRFRIEARTAKLLGLWAAALMGMSGDVAENYAKDVVGANLDEPGFDDVKRKVRHDLKGRDVAFDENEFDQKLVEFLAEAEHQIITQG